MAAPPDIAPDIESARTQHAADLPAYHFTSPTGHDCMPFDPNGAIWHNGRYHLGYIYQQNDRHFWGHVSSTNLIHWKMHPPMLSPGPDGGIFSGNAFMDKQGRVVLSYHGLGNPDPKVDAGNCLAVAEDDDLNVFKKLDGNPVMKNPGWDPHTWLDGDVYYSISGGNPGSRKAPSLYSSTDDSLAKWNMAGPLMSREMPDVFPEEDISCPDLFTLGGKQVLLCISHSRGARYYVGSFVDGRFHPEAHYRMNWPGGSCFAPETLLDNKGRRIMWAWVLGSPSTMTLPRVLSMNTDGVMHIEPVKELDSLRGNHQSLRNVTVPAGRDVPAKGILGDCKELRVTLDPGSAQACGIRVRCSPDSKEETAITYVPARGILRIDMERSSLDSAVRPRTYAMSFMLQPGAENPEVTAQEAPFELAPGELLDLRIYIDRSILEVFANGRQCITQRIWPTRPDSMGISFFSTGSDMTVKSLDAWDMSATTLAQ